MFQGSGYVGLKVCRLWGCCILWQTKDGRNQMHVTHVMTHQWTHPFAGRLLKDILSQEDTKKSFENVESVLQESWVWRLSLLYPIVSYCANCEFQAYSGQVSFFRLHGYWTSRCTQPPSRDLARLVAAGVCDIARVWSKWNRAQLL